MGETEGCIGNRIIGEWLSFMSIIINRLVGTNFISKIELKALELKLNSISFFST